MGLTIAVPGHGDCSLTELLARLQQAGLATTLVMVDGQLCAPTQAPPAAWREARLGTPAGTITLKRSAAEIAVVVFGNAGPALAAAQETVAAALRVPDLAVP